MRIILNKIIGISEILPCGIWDFPQLNITMLIRLVRFPGAAGHKHATLPHPFFRLSALRAHIPLFHSDLSPFLFGVRHLKALLTFDASQSSAPILFHLTPHSFQPHYLLLSLQKMSITLRRKDKRQFFWNLIIYRKDTS